MDTVSHGPRLIGNTHKIANARNRRVGILEVLNLFKSVPLPGVRLRVMGVACMSRVAGSAVAREEVRREPQRGIVCGVIIFLGVENIQ